MKTAGDLVRKALAAFNAGDYPRVRTLCRKALKHRGGDLGALQLLGLAELRLGRPQQAAAVFAQVLRARPDECSAHYNLGLAHYRAHHADEALRFFRRAVSIDPGFAQGYTDLALCLKDSGRLDEAIVAAEQACERDPTVAAFQNNAGIVYEAYGLLDRAFQTYGKAVELDANHPVFFKNYGLALLGYGDREQAGQCFRKALQIAPEYGEAWRHLVMTRTYVSADDEDIRTLEALRDRKNLQGSDRVDVLFALGKVYDDCSRYKAAFTCIKAANDIERNAFAFQPEKLRERYMENVEVFQALSPPDPAPQNADALPLPIFVVGLPRSGTSLVERILAGHSRVFGTGERTWFHELEQRLPALVGSKEPYPYCLHDLNETSRRQLAVEYQRHLKAVSDGSDYVVDKLPGNFERLGLIALLFPKAPVIHCRRNLLDACLSMYFQRFPGALHFSYDLGHLGEYCCFHDAIMSFWRTWRGELIQDVEYEKLVQNPESEARRLFNFIGLPWEAECVDRVAHRWVRTASDHQVHGKIYCSSLGRWTRYKDQLTGLKAIIENCDNWGDQKLLV